jgi:hypothetical protein
MKYPLALSRFLVVATVAAQGLAAACVPQPSDGSPSNGNGAASGSDAGTEAGRGGSSGAGGSGGSTGSTGGSSGGSTGAGGESSAGSGGTAGSQGSGGSLGSGGSADPGTGGTAGPGGASGGDASSGTGADLPSGGGPCPGAGKALEFDGDMKTKVTADLGADLPIGNASRTVELWAYFSGPKSWRAEHSITEYGAGMPCHVFGIDVDGVARLDPYSNGCGGDNTYAVAPVPATVGWLHLAWVYDGPTHTFLFTVNGVTQPIKSTHTTGMMDLPTTKSAVAIGAANVFGNTGFTGKIDEYRVWNVARTEAEIAAWMKVILKENTPGLVAYYHFDEGTGTMVKDASGKGHDGMMVSAVMPKWVDSDLKLTCQ